MGQISVAFPDAIITYQQVYVNNEYAAKYDFEKQTEKHKDYILRGGLYHLESSNFLPILEKGFLRVVKEEDGIGCEARSVFRLLPIRSQAAG